MQALQTCASRLALRLEPCRTRTQDVSQRGRTTIDVVLLHFLHYFHSFIPSSGTKKRRGMMPWRVAPQVRLELTTLRLTAECSAIELLRIIFSIHLFCYVWEREKLPFPRSCGSRQLPTLPSRSQLSTISVWRLNFCVRYGYRWCPPAIVTGNFP